jgi:Ca2+-binding EF-hand superfamily protein
MKTTRIYATAAVLLAGTAAIAQAGQAAQIPQPDLTAKALTRAELQARVREHFAKADANRDGVLTTDEIGTRAAIRPGMAATDRKDAAPADPNAMFDRIDSNHDGAISRSEFNSHRQVRVERRVALRKGEAADAGQGWRKDRGRRMGGMMMLKMADGNKDGRITLAEAEGAALHHFDMADSNRDGQVTREERDQMRRQMRSERLQKRR